MNGYFVMVFVFIGIAIIIGWDIGAILLAMGNKWWEKTIGISMLVILFTAIFIFGAMVINGTIPNEISL